MSYYTGTWTFRNVMHPKHGKSGRARVEASSEEDARQKICDEGSRAVFGRGMLTYFSASDVRKESGW